jgi:DNA (cytosine-5)-methyltransferase 1
VLNGLDLFSGIGGIGLALKPWVRTVAYCEADRYAQAVLLSRMWSGDLDRAPIWDDVRTLRGDMLPPIDIIFGGFPCQDLSVAGLGAGLEGSRSGLVFELLRLARECRPRFLFLENVPALAVRGLDRLLLELHALGHDARWTIVSALEVGAPHLRRRVWIVSNAACERRGKDGLAIDGGGPGLWAIGSGSERTATNTHGKRGRDQSKCIRRISDTSEPRLSREDRNAPDAKSPGLEGGGQGLPRLSGWGAIEPAIRRGNHGLPHRVDRIKCLGNAVVPHSAREAFKRLIGLN